MLALSATDVRELLTMPACIDLMDDALAALARGEAATPLRSLLWLPERFGLLGMMPATYLPAGVMGIKVVSVMPGNHGTSYDAHQGSVLIFETRNGVPLAVADGSEITAIRTAAVSGAATRALAREDATDLAILGSGTQARTHLEAMLAVRPIERVRVWSRNAVHAAEFARRESDRLEIQIEAEADSQRAVEGASIICTTTAAREPVVQGDWLEPGAHINAVGSCVPNAREFDSRAMARSRIYADSRESIFNEAGDFLLARAEGVVQDGDVVAELGELFAGRAPGRTSADDITMFKSLGLGVEDVAATWFVYTRARELGRGVELPA